MRALYLFSEIREACPLRKRTCVLLFFMFVLYALWIEEAEVDVVVPHDGQRAPGPEEGTPPLAEIMSANSASPPTKVLIDSDFPCLATAMGTARLVLDSKPMLYNGRTAMHAYPLTSALIEQGVASNATGAQMAVVLTKLRNRQPVQLGALGGSFTSGIGCNNGTVEDFACSYATRTKQWMQRAFPDSTITMTDLTRQGTTSGHTDPLASQI